MGRNDTDRETVKLPFKGKKIKLYRPTDGQVTAIVLAAKRKDFDVGTMLVRIFRVLEAVVVDPADWDWMDEAMVLGDASVGDFQDLLKALMHYEWPEDESEDD